MITYYSKFISNLSSITYPLRLLLQKNRRFHWSDACDKAFCKLKNEIASDKVLTPFNPDLPVVLTCGASPTGIAAVLSHTINKEDRSIAFISRALTPSEQNYSQLDREALAIVFAVNKFYLYLFGRRFTLITDNTPLSRIFHQDAKLPVMSASRLLRYATILNGFDYVVKHKKSTDITHVDYLSRSPLLLQMPDFNEDDIIFHQTINHISTETISSKSIAVATMNDPELNQLLRKLQNGNIQDEQYSLQEGVIFRGHQIIIPKSLQCEILRELHVTHTKISKMKSLARRYCYWKNIDANIETINHVNPVQKQPSLQARHLFIHGMSQTVISNVYT